MSQVEAIEEAEAGGYPAQGGLPAGGPSGGSPHLYDRANAAEVLHTIDDEDARREKIFAEDQRAARER